MKKSRIGILFSFVIVCTLVASVIADGDGNGGSGSSSGSSGGSSGGGDGGSGSSSSSGNGDSSSSTDGSSDADGGGSSSDGDDGNGDESESNGKSGTSSQQGTTTEDRTGKDMNAEPEETEEAEEEEVGKVETEVEDGKTKTKVILADGTIIKTKIEEDKTKIKIIQGGVEVRFEREGDRFRIKVENAQGEEAGLDEGEIVLFEERPDRIKVQALGERVLLQQQDVQALSALPITVDLATNELKVTTPAGEKIVAVLPDQAVQNMLAANVIDHIGGQELASIVQQEQVTALPQIVQLAEKNGVPIYEVRGLRDNRLFGFIPIITEVAVTASAETGEVLTTEQSFVDTVIDALSTNPPPVQEPVPVTVG